MKRLQEKYKEEVAPKLKEQFGYKNDMEVPAIQKVILNIGTSKALQDQKYLETMQSTLQRVTGQKPVLTEAKKSISNFKIREGMKVGMKVTLRGQRMNDFLDKLINYTLPRVRDFRGLPEKSVDRNGNITIGFKEHIVFPEIKTDEVEHIHGVEVVITTTAKTQEEGLVLLKLLGLPLVK